MMAIVFIRCQDRFFISCHLAVGKMKNIYLLITNMKYADLNLKDEMIKILSSKNVKIQELTPYSKNKNWRLVKLLMRREMKRLRI